LQYLSEAVEIYILRDKAELIKSLVLRAPTLPIIKPFCYISEVAIVDE